MTLRWKLTLTVIAFEAVFLTAAAFSISAVTENAEFARLYSRARNLSAFTSDVRAAIYQHVAARDGAPLFPGETEPEPWPAYLIEYIDLQTRRVPAENPNELHLWEEVEDAVRGISATLPAGAIDDDTLASLRQAERHLWQLSKLYERDQNNYINQIANTSLKAQDAVKVASGVTVLLFLVYLIMVRDWLVRPVEVLKSSADAIGKGRLDHRVPLKGQNELAQLARHIDNMAEGLARHQAALLEARELSAIGELCTNVAHGLKNPLAAIRASAQLAERRAASAPELKSMIHDLGEQADRMNQCITKLFQFGRPLELRRHCTAFRDLAQSAQAGAQPLLQANDVRLSVEDQSGQSLWSLDGDQLAQAIAELITNAVHHSPAGGEIRLSGSVAPPLNGQGAALRIQVADAGSGMSEATAEKAFDLFFTTRPDGSGMGLAMARRIVEKHAGRITLASRRGAGTTVTILLPCQCGATAPIASKVEDTEEDAAAPPNAP